MNELYERIYKSAESIKEDAGFSRNMNSLFSQRALGAMDIAEVPIAPKKIEWEENSDYTKTTLTRSFAFDSGKHLRFFVNEILKESDRMQHHPELRISGMEVEVELYTHDINDISEADLKLAKFVDEIYDDVKFIQEF